MSEFDVIFVAVIGGGGLGIAIWQAFVLRARRRQKRQTLTVSHGFMRSDKGKTIEIQGRTYTIAEVESMGLARIELAKRRWWKRARSPK